MVAINCNNIGINNELNGEMASMFLCNDPRKVSKHINILHINKLFVVDKMMFGCQTSGHQRPGHQVLE